MNLGFSLSGIVDVFSALSIQEITSSFVVLFAIIDMTGAIPIIINLKQKCEIPCAKVAIYSFLILFTFLFAGQALLSLFGVDIKSFAVAGAIVLLILAAEMLLDVEIFKTSNEPGSSPVVVPLIFPLIAGAGVLTTLLSLKATYAVINIIIALILNMVVVYLVLKYVYIVEKILGKGGIFVLRKFFSIILLAMSVRLFSQNIAELFSSF